MAHRGCRGLGLGRMIGLLALSASVMLGTLSGAAQAQTGAGGAWPARPINLVVPFPPGGVADTIGRPVAEALARELRQPVIVENRAGAGGGVGMAYVAKAGADGYTVLMALSSISIIPEADRILERAPMYQLAQLRPIARFTADPTVLVVRADSKWKTLADWIADVRAHPSTYGYSSSGNYGTMHVPMEMLAHQAGLKMLHVPYTGAAPAILSLLSGQVDAVATGPASVLQHIKAGKVRALAHWGTGRLAALPEVPSLAESGYPVEFAQWSGLFVPAATPEAVVTRLRDAARAAARDPRVQQTLNAAGSPVQYLDAPEFQRYWDADAKRMRDVIRRIGKLE